MSKRKGRYKKYVPGRSIEEICDNELLFLVYMNTSMKTGISLIEWLRVSRPDFIERYKVFL